MPHVENTDDPIRLSDILEALTQIFKDMPVVLPPHPRTRKAIEAAGLSNLTGHSEAADNTDRPKNPGLVTLDPVAYLDILQLEQHAAIIPTDSGGMQKEAFWLGVPCITLRHETEWVETVEAGWNKVVGTEKEQILDALCRFASGNASLSRSVAGQNPVGFCRDSIPPLLLPRLLEH